MIDSNVTIAYEDGRDAGYREGYEDGFNNKIKTMNPLQSEIIILSFNFDEIDLETMKHLFDRVQSKFPDNTVIAVPDKVSLESWTKNTLINYVNMIDEIIKND